MLDKDMGLGLGPVPCKWCGDLTIMTGTKMCDRCFELDHRIRGDRTIAKKILEYYEQKTLNKEIKQ